MGQAKQRGDKHHRLSLAIAKKDSLKPNAVVCEDCKREVSNLETNESRNIPGIDAVFSGTCECGATCFAIYGDPATAARLLSFLKAAIENEGKSFSKHVNGNF